jgi:NAD(P) transhydrogenase subunit beta
MIGQVIPLLYVAAATSFILALKWLSGVATARRGVLVGVLGMALAVGGTLLNPEIVSYRWIAGAIVSARSSAFRWQ